MSHTYIQYIKPLYSPDVSSMHPPTSHVPPLISLELAAAAARCAAPGIVR